MHETAIGQPEAYVFHRRISNDSEHVSRPFNELSNGARSFILPRGRVSRGKIDPSDAHRTVTTFSKRCACVAQTDSTGRVAETRRSHLYFSRAFNDCRNFARLQCPAAVGIWLDEKKKTKQMGGFGFFTSP